MMKCIATAGAVIAIAMSAAAQPSHGDLVIGDGGRMFKHVAYIDVNGSPPTITSMSPSVGATGLFSWMMMDHNNQDIITIVNGSPQNRLERVTPNGVVTTITQLGAAFSRPSGQSSDLTQEGDYYIAMSGSPASHIEVVTPQGARSTIVSGVQGSINAVGRDHDTGNIIVGIYVRGGLGGPVWEFDRTTGALLRTITLVDQIDSLDPHPQTGGYVVSSRTAPNVRLYDRNGAQTLGTTFAPGFLTALKVDDNTGNVFVCSGFTDIFEYASDLSAVVNTYGRFGNYTFGCFDVYGSQTISGSGPVQSGTPYALNIDFGQGAGNFGYAVGLSFAQRPGIAIPGAGTVNLAFDPLLVLSVTGALNGSVLTGFPATLDSNGRAQGTINIPSGLPSGLGFFASAIAFAGPSFFTGNTIGLHLN